MDEKPRHLITGQHIDPVKVHLAWLMRRAPTPTEDMLWRRLRGGRLGLPFRRQQVAFGFFADFYCNPVRLVVEVDGAVHDAAYDAERDQVFRQQQVRVLRFRADDVEQRVGYVLWRIRQALAE